MAAKVLLAMIVLPLSAEVLAALEQLPE